MTCVSKNASLLVLDGLEARCLYKLLEEIQVLVLLFSIVSD